VIYITISNFSTFKLFRAYISQVIQLELAVCIKTFLIHRIPSTKLLNQKFLKNCVIVKKKFFRYEHLVE